jgi:hypothetical protein
MSIPLLIKILNLIKGKKAFSTIKDRRKSKNRRKQAKRNIKPLEDEIDMNTGVAFEKTTKRVPREGR